MRHLFLILMFGLGVYVGLPTAASGQSWDASIKGDSKGCFAGKLYHPGKVEIYVFAVGEAPEIPKLIHQMEGFARRNDSPGQQRFFESYNHLLNQVSVSKVLGRIRSDRFGTFSFSNLPTGVPVVVVGISPMEDDPAFYAYKELAGLKKGDNAVTLDFARGDRCE